MKAIKLSDDLIALNAHDVKHLEIGKVFQVTIKGVIYDLVLKDKTLYNKKYNFFRYNIICLSHENVKVTEFLNV